MIATFRHADAVLADVAGALRPQAAVAQRLLDEYLGADEAPTPGAADLTAVARAGHPWNVLAPVSTTYLRYSRSLQDLALELIYPIDSLRWRLFHLGVLSEILGALQETGARVRWLAPLSGAGGVPQYRADIKPDVSLEVWFEAAGVWRRHSSRSPYREAMGALELNASPIGPDILVIDVQRRAALVLECKYGNARYVGRSGYLQALAYASELRVDLVDDIWSYVVGPDGVVVGASHTELHADQLAQRVGVTSPSALPGIVVAFIDFLRR